VTIQGLTVEKFADEGQLPAVASRYNWAIVNDDIRLNHGIGVGDAGLVSGSFIHDNGEMGISMSAITASSGSPFQVVNNEISANNYAGYDPNWESGCCKFSAVNGLEVSGNYIHDNLGKGLWSDGDNFNVVYENNRIINNQYNGINHELSYNAIIRNNDIEGNGFGTLATTPLEGSGIELSNSCCTEIYGNTVKGNRDGIGLVQSDRPAGPYGTYITHDDNIHDNTIGLGGTAYNGMIEWISDGSYFTSKNNSFSHNTYLLGCAATSTPFIWQDPGNLSIAGFLTASQWRAENQDPTGTFSSSC
jgi:parallel beta-helix repeat protein